MVSATRARDHDPRGGLTESSTADDWQTVSSAVSRPSLPVLSSSNSLGNS